MTVSKSDVAANRKALNLPQRMERFPLTRYQRSIFFNHRDGLAFRLHGPGDDDVYPCAHQ